MPIQSGPMVIRSWIRFRRNWTNVAKYFHKIVRSTNPNWGRVFFCNVISYDVVYQISCNLYPLNYKMIHIVKSCFAKLLLISPMLINRKSTEIFLIRPGFKHTLHVLFYILKCDLTIWSIFFLVLLDLFIIQTSSFIWPKIMDNFIRRFCVWIIHVECFKMSFFVKY